MTYMLFDVETGNAITSLDSVQSGLAIMRRLDDPALAVIGFDDDGMAVQTWTLP